MSASPWPWDLAAARLGRAVCFTNGTVLASDGHASSIRFRSRILSLDEPPRRGDIVIDLEGAFVLPGLINAHDHLELNHFGPLKPRARYANVTQWIDDLRPLIRSDPEIRRNAAFPLPDRLFIGGLKNLLAGVTTVAHHNPLYRGITRAVPIRVLRRFGWAHSLALEREPVGAGGEPGGEVRERLRRTPARWPFIVHAAEGTDAAGAEEVVRLEAQGCVRPNTVIVHGVAVTPQAWPTIAGRGASLVWCPHSNEFLLGRTAPLRAFLDMHPDSRDRICLGTDSRLTGAADLLDEMRQAERVRVCPGELLHMVTRAAAAVLRLDGPGTLRRGAPADLIVVPRLVPDPAGALLATRRSQLLLVALDGRPLVGEGRFAPIFAARTVRAEPLVVDGSVRIADAGLVRRIRGCAIREPGVLCG